MPMFDDREEAFEKKFAHDEELKFKVNARTNKLLALWAAQQAGMDEAEAMKYALDVVEAGMSLKGEWDVASKIRSDLKRRGKDITEDAIRKEKSRLMTEAEKQIRAGK